jgi:anaerobic magnesium-protoporphyrin IX monomethyl ester cyclase
MKILLIRTQFRGYFDEYTAPPLGLAYLSSTLEKEKNEVKILDGWVEDLDKLLPKTIKEFNPELIGFSGLTVDINRTFGVIEKTKRLAPNTPIIFGGPHASMDPINSLKNNKAIDMVIVGEGEKTILNIIDYLKKKQNIKNLKGVYYRDKNEIKFNGPAELITNLDKLPFPSRHLLHMGKYKPSPKEHKRFPGTDMITSRGCPYQCAFCFKQVFGNKYRSHSPEHVIKEIKELISKYGIKDIFFRDDTFTIDKERVIKICDLIKKHNIDITFTTLARVDRLDFEVLKRMKEAGCWKILLGIESGNQKSLNLLRKGITLEQVKTAVDYCKKLKIETDGFFILGIPGESKKDAKKTIKFAKSLGLDFAQFYICTPYPGTHLYQLSKKYGELHIKENEWEKFNQFGAAEPLFIPTGWTSKELKKYQAMAWRKFYFNANYIFGRIKKIKSFEEFKNYAKGALKLIKMFGK